MYELSRLSISQDGLVEWQLVCLAETTWLAEKFGRVLYLDAVDDIFLSQMLQRSHVQVAQAFMPGLQTTCHRYVSFDPHSRHSKKHPVDFIVLFDSVGYCFLSLLDTYIVAQK